MGTQEERLKPKRPFKAEIYVFAALSFLSFSLLLFSTRSLMTEVRDAGLSLFSGVRGGVYGVSSAITRTVLSIQELARLKRAYEELTERMVRYEQLERSAADIRQENHRLREQLGFAQTPRYRHIAAEIIAQDPDNLYSALVINKGRRHGVAVEMPVVAYQNGNEALVGKVIQTAPFESLVMPLYDVSFFVSARFSGSRYEGLVEGQGDRESPLLMRSIPKRARDEIHQGDLIISSGLGRVYPPGVTVGRVSGVIFEEAEPSMTVELESAIIFSRLEYVFVVEPEREAPPPEEPVTEAAEAEEAAGD